MSDTKQIVVNAGAVVCYCPHCHAYLFWVDPGPVICPECDGAFEIVGMR